jgi:hypothetical protein
MFNRFKPNQRRLPQIPKSGRTFLQLIFTSAFIFEILSNRPNWAFSFGALMIVVFAIGIGREFKTSLNTGPIGWSLEMPRFDEKKELTTDTAFRELVDGNSEIEETVSELISDIEDSAEYARVGNEYRKIIQKGILGEAIRVASASGFSPDRVNVTSAPNIYYLNDQNELVQSDNSVDQDLLGQIEKLEKVKEELLGYIKTLPTPQIGDNPSLPWVRHRESVMREFGANELRLKTLIREKHIELLRGYSEATRSYHERFGASEPLQGGRVPVQNLGEMTLAHNQVKEAKEALEQFRRKYPNLWEE